MIKYHTAEGFFVVFGPNFHNLSNISANFCFPLWARSHIPWAKPAVSKELHDWIQPCHPWISALPDSRHLFIWSGWTTNTNAVNPLCPSYILSLIDYCCAGLVAGTLDSRRLGAKKADELKPARTERLIFEGKSLDYCRGHHVHSCSWVIMQWSGPSANKGHHFTTKK